MNGDIKQHLQQIVRVICHSTEFGELRLDLELVNKELSVLSSSNIMSLEKFTQSLCVLNINGQISL